MYKIKPIYYYLIRTTFLRSSKTEKKSNSTHGLVHQPDVVLEKKICECFDSAGTKKERKNA